MTKKGYDDVVLADALLALERAKINIKSSMGTDDRRKALRAAAAKVRRSLDDPFQQMSGDDIMAFLRPDKTI